MRLNRIQFEPLKVQWDIIKMRSAYISAEQLILSESTTGLADGLEDFGLTPEEFAVVENMSIKDIQINKLEQELGAMAQKGKEYLDTEQYELLTELQDWYNATLDKLNKLKGL